MPELPEVQTVVNTLRPRVRGRTIREVRLTRDDVLTPPGVDFARLVAGRTVAEISRRAKRIVFTLDNGQRFYIHLGMSGRLTVQSPADPVPRHTHLLIGLDAQPATELRFTDPRRFGGIWWLGDAPDDALVGPEPLTVRPAQLAKRLARTTRAVKNALLDQAVIAGLGNIYVDESLFAAGIHPLTPANRLTVEQVNRLNRAIKTTLRRALRHRGSTLRDYRDADGNSGGFQSLHRVYGREGERCRTCRATIERIVLGGRSTHFCASCQPKDTGALPGKRKRR